MSWDIDVPYPDAAESLRFGPLGIDALWSTDNDPRDIGYSFSHAVSHGFRMEMAYLTWDLAVAHVAECGDRARRYARQDDTTRRMMDNLARHPDIPRAQVAAIVARHVR